MKKCSVATLLFMLLLLSHHSLSAQPVNCQQLQQVLGVPVKQEEGICKMSLLRKELNVRHMGKKLSPETMELEFLANFERSGSTWVVMGEFALMEKEVNPVMDRLRKAGLHVTAVHNHMLMEYPRVMYVHFQGEGTAKQVATGVKNAIQATSYPLR
jgi:hypothetical protein